MNLFPHLSSVTAEQLQPVDPDSDSSSGKPTDRPVPEGSTNQIPPALFSCGSLYILLLFFSASVDLLFSFQHPAVPF